MKSYMDVEDLEVYQKLCRLPSDLLEIRVRPSERIRIGSRFAALPTAPQHNSPEITIVMPEQD